MINPYFLASNGAVTNFQNKKISLGVMCDHVKPHGHEDHTDYQYVLIFFFIVELAIE